MLDRIINLLKAKWNQLVGLSEDPQVVLEMTYQELQADLIQSRQEVARAIAVKVQLEMKIEKEKKKGRDVSALETQLTEQCRKMAEWQKRVSGLEMEVQKAYTKKQVLIAREKAARAADGQPDIQPGMNFILFITVVALFVGIAYALTHGF